MKKFCVAIVSLIFLLSVISVSCADLSDLKWGMSLEEVQKIMGKENGFDEDSLPGTKLLSYLDQPISAFESTLLLGLRDDKFIVRAHVIEEEADSQDKFSYLAEALTQKYGDAGLNTDLMLNALKSFGTTEMDINQLTFALGFGIIQGKTWEPDGDTSIILMSALGEEKRRNILCYFHADYQESETQEYDMNGL